jgi:hypothetical protein
MAIPCNQLAIPCNQLAILCIQLAIPCNQMVIPCNQLAIPCNQLDIPCNQLATLYIQMASTAPANYLAPIPTGYPCLLLLPSFPSHLIPLLLPPPSNPAGYCLPPAGNLHSHLITQCYQLPTAYSQMVIPPTLQDGFTFSSYVATLCLRLATPYTVCTPKWLPFFQ